jgi:hypothetical protein
MKTYSKTAVVEDDESTPNNPDSAQDPNFIEKFAKDLGDGLCCVDPFLIDMIDNARNEPEKTSGVN